MKKPAPVRSKFPEASKTLTRTTAGAALRAAWRSSVEAASVGDALGAALGAGDNAGEAVKVGGVGGETMGDGVVPDIDVDLGWHHAIESTINRSIPQMSAR